MMSIFSKWLKKKIDGHSNPNYLPQFDKWWTDTYINGKKTGNRKCRKVKAKFMMPEVLKLYFEPDDPDAEKSTSIVVDPGWAGSRRWKAEMTSKVAGKKNHEHMTVVKGIRSQGEMTNEAKLTRRRKRESDDLAEAAFLW